MGPMAIVNFFARGGRRMTLDFISGPLGPLILDIWGQDFPKVMLGVKGIGVPSVGPMAIAILLLEATEEITLISFQGPWGPSALIFRAQTTQRHCGSLWATSVPSLCPHGYCRFF